MVGVFWVGDGWGGVLVLGYYGFGSNGAVVEILFCGD